jgi:hypothetical protein
LAALFISICCNTPWPEFRKQQPNVPFKRSDNILVWPCHAN